MPPFGPLNRKVWFDVSESWGSKGPSQGAGINLWCVAIWKTRENQGHSLFFLCLPFCFRLIPIKKMGQCPFAVTAEYHAG